MAELTTRMFRRPTAATLVAGTMVVAGLGLSGLNWWFIVLTGLGALGPGVLRELGWLRDKDEFQRRADQRAGYHAFLATGLVAFVLLAFVRSSEPASAGVGDLPTLLLAVLWFTWLLSTLVTYWGAQTAAARILRVFGTVWLLFAIVSNLGSEWTGWAALLLHPLLAAPFFILAWLAPRRPRIAGAVLLVAAVAAFQFLGLFRNQNLGLVTQGVTFVLFVGPLLASGIALIAVRPDDD